MNVKLKMDSKLVNRMMLALVGILLIGILLGTKTVVAQLKSQGDSLVSLKAKGQALKQEQTNLISAKAEVVKYSSLETIAKTVVPQDKNQAEAVREIVNLAAANGITLSTIAFPSSTLGSAAPVAPTTTGTSSSTPPPSSLSLSQLTAVKGIPGVYVLPIEVDDSQPNTAVSYNAFYNFLTNLEQNRRTSLVTGLNIQPLANGLVTFSLTINEYIKPL